MWSGVWCGVRCGEASAKNLLLKPPAPNQNHPTLIHPHTPRPKKPEPAHPRVRHSPRKAACSDWCDRADDECMPPLTETWRARLPYHVAPSCGSATTVHLRELPNIRHTRQRFRISNRGSGDGRGARGGGIQNACSAKHHDVLLKPEVVPMSSGFWRVVEGGSGGARWGGIPKHAC